MRFRSRAFGLTALVVAALVPLGPVLGSIRTSGRVIVTETDVVTEDLYAVGGRVIIEGVVEGDVIALTSSLTISGTVQGDVVGAVGGTADISGDVEGSVRLAAVQLDVTGSVGGDVSSLAAESRIAADVERDVLVIGGETVVDGRVGRDVRTQSWTLEVHGEVGRDVLARVDDMRLGAAARVGGDVEFKASDEVDIAEEATVNGSVVRRRVLAPVWAKATMRLFLWLSLFGFIIGGLIAIWLFRSTMPRAVERASGRPWKAAGVGVLLLVGAPLVAIPLGLSLVGLPVAVLVLLTWVVALVLGPVPAVAALGRWLSRGRAGLAGAFLLGAVVWRASIWVAALVGGLLYLAALAVGLGSFALGAWEQRREGAAEWRPLPPAPAE